MISYLAGFSLFSFLAAITPGPTNILSYSVGLKGSTRHVVAFVLAASASASTILFITYSGLSTFIADEPAVRQFMTIAGATWLSWMSYKLFRSGSTKVDEPLDIPHWGTGAFLQVINPKVWMMALTVSSLFMRTDMNHIQNAALLAFIFFTITCPSMGSWAFAGILTKRNASMKSQAWVNKVLGVSLFVMAWGMVFGAN